MNPIIRVEALSKQYRVRARSIARPTLREAFIGEFRSKLSLRARSNNKDRLLWALRDVTFEIGRGEVVGIIGRNGAGKSTLLKILSRVTKPTDGWADIYGTVGSLMEVGTGFHPDLTGRENVYLNGALLGMKQQEIARRFDEIVSFAEIEKFLDTPVKHYSTGMYLRLAFAVSAHLEAEILLLDEVLAVGDATFQNKCLHKMKEVGRQGRTVLFVSHNMAAIQQMCSRVLLVQSGRLSEEGTVASVLTRYLADASRKEDGDFDLSSHPARLSGCSSVIQRLRLYNEEGTPTMTFQPDDALIAEIDINPDMAIRDPRVAISIEDSTGQRITTAATYFQQDHLQDIVAPSRIRCRLPQLRLGSGEYLLSVSLDNKYLGMIDGLHNAARFEVIWRNNFGNGEAYSPIYGPVLSNSVWELVD